MRSSLTIIDRAVCCPSPLCSVVCVAPYQFALLRTNFHLFFLVRLLDGVQVRASHSSYHSSGSCRCRSGMFACVRACVLKHITFFLLFLFFHYSSLLLLRYVHLPTPTPPHTPPHPPPYRLVLLLSVLTSPHPLLHPIASFCSSLVLTSFESPNVCVLGSRGGDEQPVGGIAASASVHSVP